MNGTIGYRTEGHIAWLEFKNPARHNAMTYEMWCELPGLVERAGKDEDIRVLCLTGHGNRAFVSGSDISGFATDRNSPVAVKQYADAVERGLKTLNTVEKCTVAVLRGYCIGGGLSIAAACDLRLAGTDAIFAVPAGRMGVGYSLKQIERLQNLVGKSVVCDLIFSGRRVSAPEALRWGLVNAVIETDRLSEEAVKRAEQIAENAPLTLRATKLACAALSDGRLRDDVMRAEAAIAACFTSEDYQEGLSAFSERRKPEFKGR